MEKLYELATERDYDLIVLDTPPTAHALDFLEAPDRILDFLGNETARAAPRPGRGGGQDGPAALPARRQLHRPTLARFTGRTLLRRPRRVHGELPGHVRGLQGPRRRRARAPGAPDVGFVIVSSPSPLSVDEALVLPRAAARRRDAHRRRRREPRHARPVARARTRCPAPEALDRDLRPRGDGAPGLAARLARTLAEHQVVRPRGRARGADGSSRRWTAHASPSRASRATCTTSPAWRASRAWL